MKLYQDRSKHFYSNGSRRRNRNLDDIGRVLRAGADKVSLNTAAMKSKLIEEAALFYGSSIVVSIEVIKQNDGNHLAFIGNGEHTGVEVLEWIKQIQDMGAGDCINICGQEGTGEGFDIELLEKVSAEIFVPLVVHGGASSLLNIKRQ